MVIFVWDEFGFGWFGVGYGFGGFAWFCVSLGFDDFVCL